MFLSAVLLDTGKPSPQAPPLSLSWSHCGPSLLLVISSFCQKLASCQVWGLAAVGPAPPHWVLSLQWLPWQPQWHLKQGPAECLTLTLLTATCVLGWSQNSWQRSPHPMKPIILRIYSGALCMKDELVTFWQLQKTRVSCPFKYAKADTS